MPTIPVPSPSLPLLPSHSYMQVIIPSLWTTYSHTVPVWRRSSGIDKRTAPTYTLGWFPPLVIDWAPCCRSSGTPSSKGQLGPATEGISKSMIKPFYCNTSRVSLYTCSLWVVTFHVSRSWYLTLTICFPTDGLIFSSTISMTIPLSSIPRRPARPLICMYSPDVT